MTATPHDENGSPEDGGRTSDDGGGAPDEDRGGRTSDDGGFGATGAGRACHGDGGRASDCDAGRASHDDGGGAVGDDRAGAPGGGRSRGLADGHRGATVEPAAAPAVGLPEGLVEARFVERPNRFLLRCRLRAGCEPVDVHMADPGRLRELLLPEARVWVRPAGPRPPGAPPRRTGWSAVLVETPGGGGLVSVDTTLPNRLVHAALRQGALDELAGWRLVRREWTHGGSRFDFLMEPWEELGAETAGAAPGHEASGRLVLEVKSVTLVEDGVALFPDAVTARGARHVRELSEFARRPGWEAAVLFVLQRPDAERIEAAERIDPDFAAALAGARKAGVRVLGRRCGVSLRAVTLGPPVSVA